MRKLGKKNIKLFILFSIIVLVMVVLFSVSTIHFAKDNYERYDVLPGSYVHDTETRFISIEKAGEIKTNWTGQYYLNVDENVHKLGNKTVVFNKNDYKIYLYGNAHEVFKGGNVTLHTGETEIVRIGTPSFYKLDDRKYLIVAKSIKSSNGEFQTKNYLIIHVDRKGNALLMNNEKNIKTINPLIMETSDFKFDIANEKLIFSTEEINLKNINGSSNEYVPVVKTSDDEDSEKDNNNQSTNITNNNIQNNNNNANIGSIIYGDKNNDEKIEILKWVSLKGMVPGVTYIDIDYQVVDVSNEINTVFVIVEDNQGNKTRLHLNKQNTNYRIRNLIPNYEYKVSFGYSYVDSSSGVNTLVEKIEDISTISTTKPQSSISIEKITNDRIYYNVKFDSEYKFESAAIKLFIDNNFIAQENIDVDKAVTKDGFSSSLYVPTNGRFVVLRLEDLIFDGESVNFKIENAYLNE